MKSLTTLGLLLLLSLQSTAQHLVTQLQEGDLLFCLSAQDNHITQVTEGVEGQRIDHVGIVHLRQDSVYVLEAVHQGVVLTPVDRFLARRDSLVMAMRLHDTTQVAQSVRRALQYVGRPYDFLFMPGDSAFYCSELVQMNYLDARGALVFQPIPMSFHDKTGKVTQFWKDYYARRGMPVPEGEPGSNPGDLSRSQNLRFLFRSF
jgi:hypothetical protein